MPVYPFRGVTVIVEVLKDPLLMVRVVGEAEIEKSGLTTCTVNDTL